MSHSGFGSASERSRALVASVGVVLAAYLLGLVLAGLGYSLLGGFGIPVSERPLIQQAVGVIALQGLAFLPVSLLYLHSRDRFDMLSIRRPTLRDVGIAVLGVAALFGTLQLLSIVYGLLNITPAEPSLSSDIATTPTLALLLIPASYLLVGPGEELLFRGVVQGLLREAYPRSLAIGFASVLFALVHGWNVSGPTPDVLAYLFVIFTLSLVLGAIYEYSENILVVMAVHGTYNAASFVQLYFDATA